MAPDRSPQASSTQGNDNIITTYLYRADRTIKTETVGQQQTSSTTLHSSDGEKLQWKFGSLFTVSIPF
jgi:hypothetical protein